MDNVWLAAAAAGGVAALPVLWLGVRFAFKKRLKVHRSRLVEQLRTTEELARASQYKLNMARDLLEKSEAQQAPMLDELEVLRAQLAVLYEQKANEPSETVETAEPTLTAEDANEFAQMKEQMEAVETARDAAERRASTLEADLRAIRHQLQSSKDAQSINIRRLNELETANAELGSKVKEAEGRTQILELKIKQDETENALVAGETQNRIANLQEIVSQRDKQIKRMRSEISELRSDGGDATAGADDDTAPHLALVPDEEAEDADQASDRAAAQA